MTNTADHFDSFLNGGGEESKKKEETNFPSSEGTQTLREESSDGASLTPSVSINGSDIRSFVEPPRNDVRSMNERPKESVFWIETVKIKPNPEQPRTTFDEDKIRALAESIRQYGILQPIVVSKREIDVPTGTHVEYQIIAGERRYRAAQMIGLVHMPAVIRREDSDRIKLELALIENLQREDLQPLEKAH